MEEHIIAERYAKALSQVVNKDQWDEVIDQLMTVNTRLNGKVMICLASPIIPYRVRKIFLDKILSCGQFLPAVENFLTIILQQGRFVLLPFIIEELKAIIHEERNIILSHVRCAFPLTKEDEQKIIEKLSVLSGKNLECTFEYDTSLITGIIAQVGNVIYDCSLKNRLLRLETTLQKVT